MMKTRCDQYKWVRRKRKGEFVQLEAITGGITSKYII